ncbi:MAG: hypothetical protein Q8L79_03370 [Methylobacter sp.]|uniref:hypothetical protein n=1 Tax=Methylobacter sp. TaxID=2051955 RepID=UPI0027313734|nr:hypothetical protein [Methylobacter sp.]MDP1664142.1 hypothetical protein [Methylobacter sp.]
MRWKYTNGSNTVVSRTNADGTHESKLVEAIADWIGEGNTPEPANTQAIVIPEVVTMAQMCLALLAKDKYLEVDAAISQMPLAAQIQWQRETRVRRDHDLVASLQVLFQWTDVQMDELFTLADTL